MGKRILRHRRRACGHHIGRRPRKSALQAVRGKTLAAIAAEWKVDPRDALLDIVHGGDAGLTMVITKAYFTGLIGFIQSVSAGNATSQR
jgi:hypothetical protein